MKLKTGNKKDSVLSGDFGEAQLPTLSFCHTRLIDRVTFNLLRNRPFHNADSQRIRSCVHPDGSADLENMDLDAVIEKNKEKAERKAEKRREKMGVYQNQIYNAASMSTKRETNLSHSISSEEKNQKVQKAYETAQVARNVNPNSLTAKANLVKEFNERNNK